MAAVLRARDVGDVGLPAARVRGRARGPCRVPRPTAGGYSSRSKPSRVGMSSSRRSRRASAPGRLSTSVRGQPRRRAARKWRRMWGYLVLEKEIGWTPAGAGAAALGGGGGGGRRRRPRARPVPRTGRAATRSRCRRRRGRGCRRRAGRRPGWGSRRRWRRRGRAATSRARTRRRWRRRGRRSRAQARRAWRGASEGSEACGESRVVTGQI